VTRKTDRGNGRAPTGGRRRAGLLGAVTVAAVAMAIVPTAGASDGPLQARSTASGVAADSA
jgi:hypothetical protein